MTATSSDDQPHPDAGFFIQVVLAGLLVLVVALAIGWTTGAKTGAMADWVAGVSAFATFIAAVIAGRYAYKALLVEQVRDQRRDEDDRNRERRETRRQAEKIAAWGGPVSASKTNGTYDSPHVSIKIRNASDLPITDVALRFTLRIVLAGGTNWDAHFEEVGSHREILVPPDADPVSVKPTPALILKLHSVMNQHMDRDFYLLVDLSFADAAGRLWARDATGTLREDRGQQSDDETVGTGS